jgi:gas vesicle protein
MTHDDDGHAKPFAAGLLIGALLGAGVALLFAPQSGSDTRRMIRKRAKKLAAGAEDRFDDVKDRIRQARRKAEEAFSD